ncbi:MAG: glycosyltransferase [Candidatus Dojkabacteria bacterium]
MKIAVISSNTLATPPDPSTVQPEWTTSIHDVVSTITEGLVARGHDVTLFASGNSKTSAKLESAWEKPSVEYYVTEKQFDYGLEDQILISYALHKIIEEGDFDIIYSYHSLDIGPFAFISPVPIVSTIHGPGDIGLEKKFIPKFIKPPLFVGLSKFQTEKMHEIEFVEIINHGVDTQLYKFDSEGGEDLLYVGRLVEDKGIDIAMKAATELKKKINILGLATKEYMENSLNNLITEYTNLIGQKPKAEASKYFEKAKALLFPIRWDEPFGLVAVESLSAGTPVITFARGAMPEIIEDGKTGFLINLDESTKRGEWIIKQTGEDGIKEALNKLDSMSKAEYLQMRKDCRESVEKRFNKEIMIDNYEELFNKIIIAKTK